MGGPGAGSTGITKILVLSIALHSSLPVNLDPVSPKFFHPHGRTLVLWLQGTVPIIQRGRSSGRKDRMLTNDLFSISSLQIEWLN